MPDPAFRGSLSFEFVGHIFVGHVVEFAAVGADAAEDLEFAVVFLRQLGGEEVRRFDRSRSARDHG